MVEPEKPPKNSRKAQIQIDEELAIRLHEKEKAELERMQETGVPKEASNVALIAEFDDNKSLEEIQKLYEREHKWINDFVPMDSEMVKDSGKKYDDSRKEAESSQKQAKNRNYEMMLKKEELRGYVGYRFQGMILLFELTLEDESLEESTGLQLDNLEIIRLMLSLCIVDGYWNCYSDDGREDISSYIGNAFKDVEQKAKS
ncbi:hypothetical protein Tco_1344812 [Tanacetum coccineum]